MLKQRQFELIRKRSLTLEELTVGEDSLEVAKNLNNLALLNYTQKNYK